MNTHFETVHNHNEEVIFRSINDSAVLYAVPSDQPELLADVACVALNRMPPRYICHDVDLSFYTNDADRAKNAAAVKAAVEFACGFVQSRVHAPSRT
jgi:hypothetical protein